MTMDIFNQLKKESRNGKVFLIMEHGKSIICKNIFDLPFLDKTLGDYMLDLEASYNDRLSTLEGKLNKQELAINELLSAIKQLNK